MKTMGFCARPGLTCSSGQMLLGMSRPLDPRLRLLVKEAADGYRSMRLTMICNTEGSRTWWLVVWEGGLRVCRPMLETYCAHFSVRPLAT